MSSGVVLAGGQSSRMGRPKALVPLGGVPLLGRVLAALGPICDELIVVAAPGMLDAINPVAATAGARLVADQKPGEGPLSGLVDGLTTATADRCFLAGCDMPFLNPVIAGRLLALLDDRCPEVDAAVPVDCDGHVQPLHAAYRTAAAPALAARLDEGQRAVRAGLAAISVLWVDVGQWDDLHPGAPWWWSLNTPMDVEAAERVMGLRRPP